MAEIPEKIRTDLIEALSRGNTNDAEAITRQALKEGVDPLELIQKVVVPTLTEVGKMFQNFDIFLPELMMAGEAGNHATVLLEESIAKAGEQIASLGTVVIGTVESDIHDIGKNIVSTMLRAHGFKVIDLGRDVLPSAFLDAAGSERADIVAMSALMTTTRPAQRSTISLFMEVGEREKYKLVIGGGSTNEEWADEIGADGYAPDAAAAVELCKQMLGEE